MVNTTSGAGGASVLEDPTGRRARWLRRAGRVVFVVFLGWLLTVVLGGLGLIPAAGIPLGHVLRPSQGPPTLTKLPTLRQPSASDLKPALTARAFAAKTAKAGGALPGKSTAGKSTAPGQLKKTSTTPAAHGRGTAPGQLKKTSTTATTPGKTIAPGQVKKTSTTTTTTTTTKGKTIAPGQVKKTSTTTTTKGKTTAPGQAKTTTTPVPRSRKP